MARVALNDPVRTKAGHVTTIAELAAQGNIRFERVERFKCSPRGPVRVAYFATMPDGGSWEIGRLAFESRTQ